MSFALLARAGSTAIGKTFGIRITSSLAHSVVSSFHRRKALK